MISKTKTGVAIVSFLMIVTLFIPFETIVVPAWKIRFVDDTGVAVSGVYVEEVCQNYTFSEANICGEYQDSRQLTGNDGTVDFVPKSISLSAVSRAFRALFFYLTLLAHGSVGVDAYLLVTTPDGYESIDLVKYTPGQSPPNEVVIKRR